MSEITVTVDSRYGNVTAGGLSFGTVQRTISCCGVNELAGFQRSGSFYSDTDQYLEAFAAVVKSPKLFRSVNACVMYLVENYIGYRIMEGALLEAGWTEMFAGLKNPNTGHKISGWSKTR